MAETNQAKNPVVTVATNKGNIRIELDAAKSPITTQNFLDYVNDRYYDGLIFHRVIPGFMIQGGGFDPQMKQKGTKAPMASKTKPAALPWQEPTWSIAPPPSFSST
jgi:cyclophilin family peptidyl-prolyl cis-trans isomerase